MLWSGLRSNRWMAVLTAILVCLIVFVGCGKKEEKPSEQPEAVDSTTWKQLNELDELADRFYKHVSGGAIVEARDTLKTLEMRLAETRLAGTASPEGIHALTDTVQQGVRIFNAVKFSMDDGQLAAAQIRLSTDALTHKDYPMWLQYYRILQNDFSSFETSLDAREGGKLNAALEQLQGHYGMIRTAALISRPDEEVVKVDSQFAFLRTQVSAKEANYAEISRGLGLLKESIDALFRKKDASAYAPIVETREPVYWALGLGLVILLALGYTAWRMIQYEQSTFPSRRRRG